MTKKQQNAPKLYEVQISEFLYDGFAASAVGVHIGPSLTVHLLDLAGVESTSGINFYNKCTCVLPTPIMLIYEQQHNGCKRAISCYDPGDREW
jgi:hypothetical protein